MKLDPHQNIIERAISGFAQLLIDVRDGYVDATTAGEFFESILRSNGALDKALLPQFGSEGLLTVEVVPRGDGSVTKAVRFTFERYSDHAIASRLLDDHLDTSDVHGSFSAGSPLHEVLHGPRNRSSRGRHRGDGHSATRAHRRRNHGASTATRQGCCAVHSSKACSGVSSRSSRNAPST